MAKKEKESIITKILGFVTDKKKLPLLLLLLGGGATVVTGTVLLANPGNGGSSTTSQTSAESSTTSQTSGGSSVPFSGNEVPNWDFDNATLDGDTTSVGVGFDYPSFSRFQNEYYYQSGMNYFEGSIESTTENDYWNREHGFSIYNMRTAEVEFLYQFEISQERRDWQIENEYLFWGNWIPLAFDQQDTIIVVLTYDFPQNGDPNFGGNYSIMETYISENFTIDSFDQWTEICFLLKFDISNQSEYTVVDAYVKNNHYRFDDILFENDRLFITQAFNNQLAINPNLITSQQKLSFTTIPSNFPTFNDTDYANFQNTYLAELNFENLNALTTISNSPITFDSYTNLNFQGYRSGFETKFMNENGDLSLGANVFVNLRIPYTLEDRTIGDYFDILEENFIAEEDRNEIYTNLETIFTRFAERNHEYISTMNPSYYINIGGFYDFSTDTLNAFSFGLNSYISTTIDDVMYNFSNNYYSNLMVMADNTTAFLITIEQSILTPSGPYSFSPFNPEYNIYSRSMLFSIDLATGEKTMIEDNDYNGKIISAIYAKAGGYYLTGTFYEVEGGREGVQSTDAFLIELNEAFEEVDILIFSGSGDDQGNQISLNDEGRPVWLISSNSSDGDFATAGASNTTGRMIIYSVTF